MLWLKKVWGSIFFIFVIANLWRFGYLIEGLWIQVHLKGEGDAS